jgi:hypothetical protein
MYSFSGRLNKIHSCWDSDIFEGLFLEDSITSTWLSQLTRNGIFDALEEDYILWRTLALTTFQLKLEINT